MVVSLKVRTSTLAILPYILIVFVYLSPPSNGAYARDSAAVFFLRSQAVNDALVQGRIEEALEYYESVAKALETDAASVAAPLRRGHAAAVRMSAGWACTPRCFSVV